MGQLQGQAWFTYTTAQAGIVVGNPGLEQQAQLKHNHWQYPFCLQLSPLDQCLHLQYEVKPC